MAGFLRRYTPSAIMNTIIRYDFTGMQFHILCCAAGIDSIRFMFFNEIFMNIAPNSAKTTIIPTSIVQTAISDAGRARTPILTTLKPAASHRALHVMSNVFRIFLPVKTVICYKYNYYLCNFAEYEKVPVGFTGKVSPDAVRRSVSVDTDVW